jgi:hypothetical protein
MAPVELVNSSLQTSVPEGMLSVNVWLVTVLTVSKLDEPAMAIALMVRFDATRKGAWYC